jgi:hypothetical protein
MNTTSTDSAMPNASSASTVAADVSSAPVTNAAVPAGTDVDSIMRKMADQQNMITSLNEQLQTKSDDVQKLSEKQRREMKHIYDTVIAGWVDQQDTVNPQTREEFKSGIMRLADEAKDDNGIWQVVMCASRAANNSRENAILKETEFQALSKNYEELKTRVDGGRFTNEEARVGSKRPAPDEQPNPMGGSTGGTSNIWDQFGDFMKNSYSNDSFAPMPPRTSQ